VTQTVCFFKSSGRDKNAET